MFTPRRVVAIIVAVACLAAAWLWAGQHRQSLLASARDRAHLDARVALTRAEAELTRQATELSKVAASGADLPGLKGIVAQYSRVDGQSDADATLRDVFAHETWWDTYRQKGTTLFFIGDRAVVTPDAEASEAVSPSALEAGTSAVSARLVALGPRALLAGAARVSVPTTQQDRGVVVLLAPPSLDLVAKAADAQVALVAHEQAQFSQGASALEAALKRPLNEEPCCATSTLVPGLTVAVFRDPGAMLAAAEDDAARTRLLALGLGGLAAASVLLLAFLERRVPPEQEKLLRDTAAQLHLSQQALLRLTQEVPKDPSAAPAAPAPATGTAAGTEAWLARTAAPTASGPRYEVVAPLGEGGMARVSVAVMKGSEGFRRHFVVKRMRPELAGNTELVNQFIDEARLGASLVHSNIVPVFDFGRDAEGYYLAQEYILGRDVNALVEASVRVRQRGLEPNVVLCIAQEALKALSYAHTRQDETGKPMTLVHRDVSPNNLMVSARGEVKLLDFGIVKSDDRLTKTKTGVVKGNLYFMSPEQARGLDVDPRSDLFSLGLVLLYAARGETLYQGHTSYELMTRAGQGLTEADRATLNALPAPLPALLGLALASDPERRYASAEAFSRAIAASGMVPATAADLQQLMATFFQDELAAEQGRLSAPAAG